MKKLFFCAAALLAALSFSACSDSDDDGQKFDTAKLLGRWVALARYDYDAESDSYVECNDKGHDIEDFVLDFQDEKTVVISSSETSQYLYTNTYTLKGSKITFSEESGYSRTYTIMRLTDTQLELRKGDIDDNYKVLYERKDIE